MKFSDFLRKINEITGLNSNELESLAASGSIQSLDLDVNDDVTAKLDDKMKSFMTLEAAKNNSELEKHFKTKMFPSLKGELLGNVDTALTGVAKRFLDEDKINSIEEIEHTKDRIKFLGEELEQVIQAKSNDDKSKKLVEDYKKQLEKAQQEKDRLEQEFKENLSKEKSQYEDKLKYKEFVRFVNDNYTFADAYSKNPTIKNALLKDFYEKATEKANIVLDDEANLQLRNKENPDMEFFIDGSKKGQLKDLVDPAVQDFLKVSDPPKKETQQPQQRQMARPEAKLNPMLQDRLNERLQAEQ